MSRRVFPRTSQGILHWKRVRYLRSGFLVQNSRTLMMMLPSVLVSVMVGERGGGGACRGEAGDTRRPVVVTKNALGRFLAAPNGSRRGGASDVSTIHRTRRRVRT